MRTAFIETLVEMARGDGRVFLLTADLGWSVLEPFAQEFPGRFLNVGVAEQNLAGVATGLAQAGYVPFMYSIANFVSLRCHEQLRNGPVLHGLPVRVVGVGGGYAYGLAGPSHYAFEDLALFRSLPGVTVLAPADPAQTRRAVRATAAVPGPVYLRVGKGNNPAVPGLDSRFAFDRPEVVRPGRDLLLLATGSIAVEAAAAGEQLAAAGISAAVAVLAHLGQSPSRSLVELLARFGVVVTAEEGVTSAGLGALVAGAVAGQRLRCRLTALGVDGPLAGPVGSPAYMLERAGLSARGLAEAARQALSRLPLAA